MMYLLRHGETVWNTERRLQGRLNSPLTLRGISQARALGTLLAEQLDDPDQYQIICSPLGRAWQTATIVAEELSQSPLSLKAEPLLIELDYGEWEGLTIGEVKEQSYQAWKCRREDRWNVKVPGGESYEQVAQRADEWLSRISEDQRCIVVCHGVTGRVIRGHYANLSSEETLELSEPQDSLFRLHKGNIEELQVQFDR